MNEEKKELTVAHNRSSSELGAQRDELEGLTVTTLRTLAAKLGVQRLSKLRKSTLIDAILEARPQIPDADSRLSSVAENGPQTENGQRSENAPGPESGLASIEALSFSFVVLGPRRIFSAWEIDEKDLQRARADLRDADAVVVLRIHDRTLIEFDDSRTVATFDVDVLSPVGNYYLNDLFPGRSYQGVLGLRARDARFRVFAKSEILETPRESAPSVVDRHVMDVRGESSQRWQARAEPPARDAWSVALAREPREYVGAAFVADPAFAADAAVVADAAVEVGRGTARETIAGPESGQSAPVDAESIEERAVHTAAAAVATETTLRPKSGAASEARVDVGLAELGLSSMALTGAAGDLPSSLSLAEMRQKGIGVSSLGLIPLVDRPSGSAVEGITDAVHVEASEDQRTLRLDIHADLVVYGSTEPGAVLYVDNKRVPVREDGTFDARFALSRPGRGDDGASGGTGESE